MTRDSDRPDDAPAGDTSLAKPKWLGFLHRGEDWIIAVGLTLLVLLPILESVLRTFFNTGLSGSSTYVQHLTLIVGMLGGALAARESRLISLSTLTVFLKGWPKTAASVFSSGVAIAITVVLVTASYDFLLTEKEGGNALPLGIPVWVVQLVMPAGFGLAAWRMLWNASEGWLGRIAALILAVAIVWFGRSAPIDPETLIKPAIGLLLVAMILGAPVFTAIAGITLIFLWGYGWPLAMIPLKHYSLTTSPTLPTIPLFALAGYFLAEGGASRRVVRVFQALFGQLRGGPAIVTVVVCAFFTSFTGASGVTILALGGLLLPVLMRSGYSEKNALGLLTGAGSLGLLFPPCIPLILYAITAGTVMSNMGTLGGIDGGIAIEDMFLAGIVPGIVLVILTAWWGIRRGPKVQKEARKFDGKEARQAIWEAKWELALPAVALTALFGGFATPVEAAAITALYAFIVETAIYRDLRVFKDTPRVMAECGLMVGGVLLILGVAMGFSNYLIFEQVPMRLVEWVSGSIESRWVFLLTLNLVLILVGCMMDIFSAIVVIVPLIIPLGLEYGIDPLHLGIIFLANLELGYITPPVGLNLFLSSTRFKKSMPEVIGSVWPMFFVLLIGVLLITYIPALTMFLPGLFE